MALTAFTSNYEDNSTEAGFQFTFFCDVCREGYKTEFIEAKSYKKQRFFNAFLFYVIMTLLVDSVTRILGILTFIVQIAIAIFLIYLVVFKIFFKIINSKTFLSFKSPTNFIKVNV